MARAVKFDGRQPWPAGIYAISAGKYGQHERAEFILPTEHGGDTVSLGDYIVEVEAGRYERMSASAVLLTFMDSVEPLPPEAYEIPPGGYSDKAIRSTKSDADKS